MLNTLFKALNDPTRREILEMLKDGDLTAGEIADRFHISKPSISHHLDLLKQADLVVSVKEGQYVTYSINTTVMDEMLKWTLQFSSKRKSHEKETLPVRPADIPADTGPPCVPGHKLYGYARHHTRAFWYTWPRQVWR